MSKHHEYSPSKYPAWAECVHFKPSDKQSDEASLGTIAHKELERDLKGLEEADNPTARWGAEEVRTLMAQHGAKVCYPEQMLNGRVKGIDDVVYGTADIIFMDEDNVPHIIDFKTFSDGTKDYTPQLIGYASLFSHLPTANTDAVYLHILHGGVRKVETVKKTLTECRNATNELLKKVINKDGEHNLCGWCVYCDKIKECPMANNAVQIVKDNAVEGFGALSITQKLVVLDAVDKLSASIREEAKRMCVENGGVLEADGIRYEMKPWAGKAKLRDICELAGEVQNPTLKNKKGEEYAVKGIDQEKLLSICDVPKTKIVEALREANADDKKVKKTDIDAWVSTFFEKTEGAPHFVRTI